MWFLLLLLVVLLHACHSTRLQKGKSNLFMPSPRSPPPTIPYLNVTLLKYRDSTNFRLQYLLMVCYTVGTAVVCVNLPKPLDAVSTRLLSPHIPSFTRNRFVLNKTSIGCITDPLNDLELSQDMHVDSRSVRSCSC